MIEREIKLKGVEHERLRARLEAAGGRPVRPAEREDNQLWDREAQLRSSGAVLRVRRTAGRCLLTFKGPARYRGASKEREELEIEVSSATVLEALLEALGYRRTFRYQKVRETWTLDQHEVVLDETPLDHFLEIEGPDPERAVARLDLQAAEVVRESYPALWQRHREHCTDAPVDMIWSEDWPTDPDSAATGSSPRARGTASS